MKKLFIFLILVVASSFASYCTEDLAAGAVTEIDGTWLGQCNTESSTGSRSSYEISNLKIVQTESFYETSSCSGTTAYSFKTTYTFVLAADATATTLPATTTVVTPKKIDTTLISLAVTPQTAVGITVLESLGISNITYTLGVEVNITGKTTSTQDVYKAAESKFYSIYILYTDGKIYSNKLMDSITSMTSPTGESDAERKTLLERTLTRF